MNKKIIMRVVLCAEVCLFSFFYIFGSQGMRVIAQMEQENIQYEAKLETLKTEIAQLEQEKNRWEQDPFLKEQIAREELQMARDDETVFYLTRN